MAHSTWPTLGSRRDARRETNPPIFGNAVHTQARANRTLDVLGQRTHRQRPEAAHLRAMQDGGTQQQDRGLIAPALHRPQPGERLGVGPVRVVHGDQQRPMARDREEFGAQTRDHGDG